MLGEVDPILVTFIFLILPFLHFFFSILSQWGMLSTIASSRHTLFFAFVSPVTLSVKEREQEEREAMSVENPPT